MNLILSAQNGNKEALDKLVKNEQANICTMLFYLKKDSSDIQDIMQDVLFKLAKKIKQLKNPSYFKTWLNQIILNSYYDYLRRKKNKQKEYYLDDKTQEKINKIVDYSTNPSDSILNNELDVIIKTSIKNLPIRYKIPITLREIQGLSYNEISNITKTSLGTVKSRIARARAIIKEDVTKYIGE